MPANKIRNRKQGNSAFEVYPETSGRPDSVSVSGKTGKQKTVITFIILRLPGFQQIMSTN